MKRVYSNIDLAMVYPIKHMLELNEIECEIRNEKLSAVGGGIPPIECWVELWVPEEQHDQAKQFVDEALAKEENGGESWVCAKCGEESEGQFTECWKCGVSRV